MPTFSAPRSLARAVAPLLIAGALGACKELYQVDPGYSNITASQTLYAVNGGPPGSPNALRFFDGVTSRADQGFGYDIVFDIDDQGRAVIIPARAIATNFSSPYSVGLQAVSGPFESVLEAPKDGYHPDTAMVAPVGQTIVVESRDFNGVCLYSVKGQSYFSKIAVTSVDLGKRAVNFTVTVNRNCGFHSFAPGLPRD